MARTDPSQLMQLAQSLARQVPAQAQMPDYGADIGSINRDYALADALAQQQYIPDSGWLGALAQIASAGAGAWKASKADKRAAELTKRMNTDAQGAQQAEAERQAAARAQQIQQIAEAYKIDPQQAAVVADGLGKAADFKAPEAEKPKLFNVKGQLVSVGPDGKPQVVYSAPSGAAAAAVPGSPLGKDLQAAVDAGLVSFEEAQKAVRQKLGVEQKPGSMKTKPIPADQAARIALTDQFLKDAPTIFKGIAAGDATGILDRASAELGRGNAGKIQRQLESGVDALRRGLTGAGMSIQESDSYVSRYLPSPTDTKEVLADKVGQLYKELLGYRGLVTQSQGAGATPQQPVAADDGWGMEEIR